MKAGATVVLTEQHLVALWVAVMADLKADWMADAMVGPMADWMVDLMVDWMAAVMVGPTADRMVERTVDRKADAMVDPLEHQSAGL